MTLGCDETRELLPEVAGGEEAGARADAARRHASACDDCGARLGELEATIALCRRAGAPPLPEGFQRELHRRLVAAAPPSPAPRAAFDWLRLRPALWAFSGAACALLLVGALRLAKPAPVPLLPAASLAYRVPESKVALVKIDFIAERAVDEVSFELTLPDGLRFFSGGKELAERSVRWTGRLSAGSNPIPIAVKGPKAGRYRVIAHAMGTDLDVTHEVVLEVTT